MVLLIPDEEEREVRVGGIQRLGDDVDPVRVVAEATTGEGGAAAAGTAPEAVNRAYSAMNDFKAPKDAT